MTLLGAILAGGRSSRFGSDKASAMIEGRPLIAHVAERLRGQTDHLIVCGRDWPGLDSVPDWPEPGLGPLGGLCAALRHAAANGYDAVVTAGCDVLPVPGRLAEQLAPGPSYFGAQRLFGLWPASLAADLERHLRTSGDRSIMTWIKLCGAREIPTGATFFNFNTPDDLAAYLRGRQAHQSQQ